MSVLYARHCLVPPDCQPSVVYAFFPAEDDELGIAPFVFRSLTKAQEYRQELVDGGWNPRPVFDLKKNPRRALACCLWRDGYTVKQVIRRLNRVLKREGLAGLLEYGFDCRDYGSDKGLADMLWVKARGVHLACFAVTGGSEGHYIHIEGLAWDHGDGAIRCSLGIGKTFEGMQVAQQIANRCAELLGA